MKKLFYLIVSSLMVSTTQAQQTTNPYQRFSAEAVKKAMLARIQSASKQQSLQKTTGTKLRIIAESEYNLQTTPINKIDSAYYKYFGSLGSTYYPSQQDFKSYFPPFLSIGGGGDYYATVNAMADSSIYWSYNPDSATYNITNVIAASYINNGKINTYEDKGSGAYPYHSRYSNTFNNQGQLKQILGLEYDTIAHTWDSSTKNTYTFNAQGRLIRDSLFEWDAMEGEWELFAIIKHSYDVNGNEKQTDFMVDAGSSFITVLKGELTYYPNNKSKTMIFSQNQGSGLLPNSKDSFAYTTGIDYSTETWTWYYDNNTWIKFSDRKLIVNNQNMPDSVFYYLWNDTTSSYKNYNITVFTYNTDLLPTRWDRYGFPANSTIAQLQNTHYFYYESYTPNSIEQTQLNAKMSLYPNPATNAINLEWKEGMGKPVHVIITNISGQLLRSESFIWSQSKETISVQSLSSGNYFISVTDAHNNKIYSGQFVKE